MNNLDSKLEYLDKLMRMKEDVSESVNAKKRINELCDSIERDLGMKTSDINIVLDGKKIIDTLKIINSGGTT